MDETKSKFFRVPSYLRKNHLVIAGLVLAAIASIYAVLTYHFPPQPKPDKNAPSKNTNQSNDKYEGLRTETYIHQQAPPIEKQNKKIITKTPELSFTKISTAHPKISAPGPEKELAPIEPPRKPKSVGISVSGYGNVIRNNVVNGADVGYEIKGENNLAEGNTHIAPKK